MSLGVTRITPWFELSWLDFWPQAVDPTWNSCPSFGSWDVQDAKDDADTGIFPQWKTKRCIFRWCCLIWVFIWDFNVGIATGDFSKVYVVMMPTSCMPIAVQNCTGLGGVGQWSKLISDLINPQICVRLTENTTTHSTSSLAQGPQWNWFRWTSRWGCTLWGSTFGYKFGTDKKMFRTPPFWGNKLTFCCRDLES